MGVIRVRRRANAIQQIQAEEDERVARGEAPQLRLSNTVAWGWSPNNAHKSITLEEHMKQDEEKEKNAKKEKKEKKEKNEKKQKKEKKEKQDLGTRPELRCRSNRGGA